MEANLRPRSRPRVGLVVWTAVRSKYRLAIVETPANWSPQHWSDRPPDGSSIIRVLPLLCNRSQAACFAMGHNTRALQEGGNRWAVGLWPTSDFASETTFCLSPPGRFRELRSKAERRAER